MEEKMHRHVKLILSTFVLLVLAVQLNAKESNPNEYLKYVNEITNSFVREMEKEWKDLYCIGSGGRMPHNVEEIEVLFVVNRKVDVEEARKIEVYGIQKLLNKINSHKKIRPFLKEYPFNTSRVDVSLSFQTKNSEYYYEGSVATVFLAKNKIFYRTAEKRKRMTMPGLDCRDMNNIIEIPSKEVIEDELIPLFEEPYEDALKIVQDKTPNPHT